MRAFFCVFFISVAWATIPTSFDARKQWSCPYTIMDQGECSSCWAFCSVESFADRMCIVNEAKVIVSMQPVIECNTAGAKCNGGVPGNAWGYLNEHGSTTCTNRCTSGCAPYDSYKKVVPKCHDTTCDSGSKWPVTYKGAGFKSMAGESVADFQTELQKNGPLQACYTVDQSFNQFFSQWPTRVWNKTGGNTVGNHCVKMMGWGVMDNMDFWLFANSWGATWGDSGYFRMKRGTNMAGIEKQVSCGYAKGQSNIIAEEGWADAPNGIHPNVFNGTQFITGGWHNQDDLDSAYVQDAVDQAMIFAREKGADGELEEVLEVKTQVCAGVNWEVKMRVGDANVLVTMHQDLKDVFFMRGFEIVF